MSVFFGGEYFAGGFFANLPAETIPSGGGSSSAHTGRVQYTRATGRLKFELPALARQPKKKAKKLEPAQVETAAVESLAAVASSLEVPTLPPYAMELIEAYRQIIENRRLQDAERERRMIQAFLDMQDEEEAVELLLMGM